MTPPLPTLTLYRIDGACSLASHMALHELKIPFTSTRMVFNPSTQRIEAADGTYPIDDYVREIHPLGQVPALQVRPPAPDGSNGDSEQAKPVVVTETPAILMYLADLAPGAKLAGATPLERAQVASWLAFLSGSVHGQAYGAVFRPRRFIDGTRFPQGEEAVREAGRKRVDLFYGQIEGRLVEGRWAVGEGLTVADLYLYVFYRWGTELGIKMDEVYPNWTNLVKRLEERPSVKTAVWLEGLGSVV